MDFGGKYYAIWAPIWLLCFGIGFGLVALIIGNGNTTQSQQIASSQATTTSPTSVNLASAVTSSSGDQATTTSPAPAKDNSVTTEQFEEWSKFEAYRDRWKINITAPNIDSFARVLDQFKIECVVFGGGVATIDYAKNLSDTAPTKYSLEKSDGRSVYNPSAENAIVWTKELCEKAGINTAGRFPTHAYPHELIRTLTKMGFDKAKAAGKTLGKVKLTTFEIRGNDGGGQLVIVNQEYDN